MANIIQAKYDTLEKIAATFQRQAEQTQALMGQVVRCVQSLSAGGWVGVGAEAFYREMGDLVMPGIDRLVNALNDASQATGVIARVFNEAEHEAARLFQGEGGPDLGGFAPFGAGPGAGTPGRESGGAGGAGQGAFEPLKPLKMMSLRFADDLIKPFTRNGDQLVNRPSTLWSRAGERNMEFVPGKGWQASEAFAEKEGFWHKNVDAKLKLFGEEFTRSAALFGHRSEHLNVEALSVEATGKYAVELGKNGLKANIGGEAGAYLARVQAMDKGDFYEIGAQGYVGANAKGEMGFVLTPTQAFANANVDLFAGARAQAHGKLGNETASLGGGVDARAGIGLEADGKLGFDNGRLKFGGSFGAALGVGAGVKFEAEVDVFRAADAVVDLGRDALDVGKTIWNLF